MSNKSVEEDLRDNMYRMKLNILHEKLLKEKPIRELPNYMEVPILSEIRDYERHLQMRRMNLEIETAKRKYEKLKEKLKFQKLENKLSSSAAIQNKTDVTHNRDNSHFNQFMEMLMLQQTQTQNLMMNQLFLKLNSEKEVQRAPSYSPIPQYYKEKPIKQNILPSQLYNTPQDKPQNTLPEQVQPVKTQPIKQEIPIPQILLSPKRVEIVHSYPGNEAQQSLRKLGFAALFCAILDSDCDENSVIISNKFLFDIKLQEIITSIQRYYLNKDQPIYSLLQSIVSKESIKFRVLLTKSSNNEITQTEQEINNAIQTLVTKISEIMPTTGTLGCESKSILSEIVQTNQTFPEKYFYAREADLIKVDSSNTVRNIGIIEGQFILIGIFYIRALVTTILLKPVDYGLAESISSVGVDNLKILASLVLKIYRMILAEYLIQRFPNEANKKLTIVASFVELNESLISDEELEPMLKYVKKTMDNCKITINKWANTYISKMKPF